MGFPENSFLLAKQIAPKDSLNLVLNAMSLHVYGEMNFDIKYSGTVAPYLDALELGTKYFDGHKGFIENKTYDAVAALAQSMFNGNFNEAVFNTSLQDTKDLKPSSRTNIRLLQSIGGVSLVSE
jgi:hypothetical protein